MFSLMDKQLVKHKFNVKQTVKREEKGGRGLDIEDRGSMKVF